MKKTIKAELLSLAHKILQLREDAPYSKMAADANALYEKLTILAYAEKLESLGKPTIGLKEIETAMDTARLKEQPQEPEETEIQLKKERKTKTPAEIVAENEQRFADARAKDTHRPDGTQFNDSEPLHEPVIEKIKDMVAEMPPEAAVIDELIDSIEPRDTFQKNDMFEIGGEYAKMPVFEPVATATEDEKPKNLNDKLKNGLKIGLNDKIAFIKHLFNGSDTDYNRVLSQLSTFNSFEEAQKFVAEVVKPDYNNWDTKEEYEERFLQIIENKYST